MEKKKIKMSIKGKFKMKDSKPSDDTKLGKLAKSNLN